jgi:hypothetical protein
MMFFENTGSPASEATDEFRGAMIPYDFGIAVCSG